MQVESTLSQGGVARWLMAFGLVSAGERELFCNIHSQRQDFAGGPGERHICFKTCIWRCNLEIVLTFGIRCSK
jgi:hypothetical protein